MTSTNLPLKGTDIPASCAENEDYTSYVADQLRDINARTQDLHGLLTRYSTHVPNDGARQQLETLENWIQLNADGLNMAVRVFEMGPEWLESLRGNLSRAVAELEQAAAEADSQKERKEAARVLHGVNDVLAGMAELFARPTPAKRR